MATISLYDPDTGDFASVTSVSGNSTQSLALINLNILIELRVISQYLAAMNQGIVGDDPQSLRADVVANGAY